jgi:hypothetical protein
MPRGFRDSLPLRAERYAAAEVLPKEAEAFAYADVAQWLKAPEPWLRKPFVQRWKPKAKEPAFRQGLIADLSFHTEWDPILFPEKYLPKKPPPPAQARPQPQPQPEAQARRVPYLEPAVSAPAASEP